MSETRPTFRDYAEHMRQVFARTDIGLAAKAVYWLLCDFAGDGDTAFPATRTMATALDIDVKTVLRATVELETAKLLSVDRPTGNPARQFNRYRLLQRWNKSSAPTNGALPLSAVERSLSGTGALAQREQNEPINEPIERTHKKKQAREADAILWTVDSGWEGVSESDRQAWAVAYPACDLDAELARMGEWLKSNPTKAHKRGWRRFLTNWLARSQERGGSQQSSRPTYNGNGQHRPAPRANPKLTEQINVRILNG